MSVSILASAFLGGFVAFAFFQLQDKSPLLEIANSVTTTARTPVLAAALMVRDEESTIHLSLEAVRKMGAQKVLLYDTGSVDRTRAIADSYNRSTAFGVEWLDGTFVDFATSRNVLLDWAQNKSDWLLLMDSGETIDHDKHAWQDITRFLRNSPANICGYMIEIDLTTTTFYSTRLIRNSGIWRYQFPVHEYITRGSAECSAPVLDKSAKAPRLRLAQDRRVTGHSSPARWIRDAKVLSELLEREPDNTRAAFYLANTYRSLAQVTADKNASDAYLNQAVDAYVERVNMARKGWWEERENSMIQLARALRKLGRYDEMKHWALKVYKENGRAEGLLELARHENDENKSPYTCYAFAALACTVERPDNRTLFMDWREYDKYRWNLRSHCAKEFFSGKNESSQGRPQTATKPTLRAD